MQQFPDRRAPAAAADMPSRKRRSGLAPVTTVLALALIGCSHLTQTASDTAAPGRLTLRVADAALASGAPDMALRVAELILHDDPHDVPALVAKGDALYAMGHPDLARGAYRAAVAADATSAEAQIGLGRTLVRSDPKAAEAAFLAVATRTPDNVTALCNLGIARDLQGRHEDAQAAYRQALAVAPDTADVKVNLGLSLALSGKTAEAIALLHPLAQETSASAVWRSDLAAALAMAGDQTEAEQMLRGEPRPADADAWTVATPSAKPPIIVAGTPVRANVIAPPPDEAIALPLAIRSAPVIPVMQLASAGTTGGQDDSTVQAVGMGQAPATFAPQRDTASEKRAKIETVRAPRSVQTLVSPALQRVTDQANPAEAPTARAAPARPIAVPIPRRDASREDPADTETGTKLAAIQPLVTGGVRPTPPAPDAPTGTASDPSSNVSAARVQPDSGDHATERFAQLGAVDTESRARAEWQRLRSLTPALLGDRIPAITRVEVRGRIFWRLRTSGFQTAAEQSTFCAAMRGHGVDCW